MFEEKTLNALKWIVGILDRKEIPYLISGGFAVKVYGGTRDLHDIDIDVPEEFLIELQKEVAPYITLPLGHFNDGKWDMELMTVLYKGQEIDLGGAYNTKLSNIDRTEWLPMKVDFSTARKIDVGGIKINVADPERIIAYKKYLDGEHQQEDIKVLQEYVTK